MYRGTINRTKLAIFVMMVGCIWLIGSAACWILFDNTIERGRTQDRQELLSLAQIAALQVNAEEHEKLTEPKQQKSKAYAAQIARLARVKAAVPTARYLYTLRKVGTTYRFVLDPTVPGDADRDGVEDKSNLLEAYDSPTEAMQAAFDRGIPTAESEPSTDRWGTFLSGFAPVFDRSGKVVAVLGLDIEYSQQVAREARLARIFFAALALIGILGAVASWFIVSALFRSGQSDRHLVRQDVASCRSLLFEVGLYALVLATVVGGWLGLDNIRQGNVANLSLQVQLRRLMAVDQKLAVALASSGLSPESFAELTAAASSSDLSVVHSFLNSKRSEIVGRPAGWRARLAECIGLVQRSAQSIQESILELQRSQAKFESWLFTLISVSVLVSMAGIVMLRNQSRQQRIVMEALQEASDFQTIYKQLVERLPIGLVAFRDGKTVFCNEQFEDQVRAESDDAWWAFLQTVSAAHGPDVSEEVRLAERDRRPFAIEAAIIAGDGCLRHVEVRGTPIYNSYGDFEHMLAFSVEVTNAVKATNEVRLKNDQLAQALSDLSSTFDATVRALVKAIDAKDPYTAGHSERVTQYALDIGRKLGLSGHELHVLEMGCLVHDIGKIAIPDAILTKPDRLTDEEYAAIKRHPERGFEMIRGIPLFEESASIVRWHHERLDGNGYPDRLSGVEIPLLVRICSVADSFDAMTSSRAYRAGMDPYFALEELRKDALNGVLDIRVVEALAEIFSSHPNYVPEVLRKVA